MSAVRTETQTKQVSSKELTPKPYVNFVVKERNTVSLVKNEAQTKMPLDKPQHKMQIVWPNAIGFLILYYSMLHALYTFYTAKLATVIFTIVMMELSTIGVTMGAHRLYTHRTFEANKYVQLILIALQTVAGQNCMWVWVRDHRQHHKFSDTDADPHNASRGFFFSHVGWLMVRKHPDVIAKGKTIDMSDLDANPYIMFQKRYYYPLFYLLSVGLPIAIPCYLWGESLWIAFVQCFLGRLGWSLNLTWLINSAAHMYGTKPFSKDILPVECQYVALFANGEGWHNYHHTFPWDYRASELGQKHNFTTSVIDYCISKGWVYNAKSASSKLVTQQATKHGDGTHPVYGKVNPVS